MLIRHRITIPAKQDAVDTQEVRTILEFGLKTLDAVGTLSLMSQRGRHALYKFLQVFDSLSRLQIQHLLVQN